MSRSKLPLFACLILLSTSALAEIYESEDSQGNPVFSDVPVSGAQEVELQESNIADAPPEMPEPPSGASPSSAPASAENKEPNIVVIPNSRNEEAEELFREGARIDAGEAQRRREVLEAEPRREVLKGPPRHHVGPGRAR